MKTQILICCVLIVLLGANSCSDTTIPEPDSISCDEFWSTISFAGICSIDFESQFDLNETPYFCKATTNDNYLHDDQIFITYHDLFDSEIAKGDYQNWLENYSSDTGFMHMSSLGDEAFSVRSNNGYGDLTYMTIYVRKDEHTFQIEVNFGHSVDACLTANNAEQIAQILVNNV